MPEGIPELASSLRRDRIERARQMSDTQKFLAGGGSSTPPAGVPNPASASITPISPKPKSSPNSAAA